MRKLESHADEEVIAGLRAGGTEAERMEAWLFHSYAYFVSSRPRKYGLDDDEAQDAYTEAFLAVVQHIREGRFRGKATIKTYLSRIFRNKCVDQLRKKTTKRVDWVEEFPDLPDPSKDFVRRIMGEEAWIEVSSALAHIGDRCQELLLMSAKGYNPEEIASHFGFKTARSASSQRYKCLEKLKEQLGAWRSTLQR